MSLKNWINIEILPATISVIKAKLGNMVLKIQPKLSPTKKIWLACDSAMAWSLSFANNEMASKCYFLALHSHSD